MSTVCRGLELGKILGDIPSIHGVMVLQVKSWRWSIFQEALREVSGSRHLTKKQTGTSLGDMIIEGTWGPPGSCKGCKSLPVAASGCQCNKLKLSW